VFLLQHKYTCPRHHASLLEIFCWPSLLVHHHSLSGGGGELYELAREWGWLEWGRNASSRDGEYM
jgi:hypothetical protein